MAAGLVLLVIGLFLIFRTVTSDNAGHNLTYHILHL